MYQIDKKQFGLFVAELRKENGLTQKLLAEKLYISDKAVSKWETGVSIPDTALLIPLAELLGVTVTELLLCHRVETGKTMAGPEVEGIVQAAITFSGETRIKSVREAGIWIWLYPAALLAGVGCMVLAYRLRMDIFSWITTPILGAIFGLYFCFFARRRLPSYYDENRISAYSDGFFRMNIPGVAFTNRNWPYVLTAGKVWSIVCMFPFPLTVTALNLLFPHGSLFMGVYLPLLFTLGGLFVPMVIVAKKYE